MKNRYLSTRIMAIMMAAAMAVSAAPAAFAAERADSETIKEDNQPAADADSDTQEDADAQDSADADKTADAEGTKTEYPLTSQPMIMMEMKSKQPMKRHRRKFLLYIREALKPCLHLAWKTVW